jgi:hypothetical protein
MSHLTEQGRKRLSDAMKARWKAGVFKDKAAKTRRKRLMAAKVNAQALKAQARTTNTKHGGKHGNQQRSSSEEVPQHQLAYAVGYIFVIRRAGKSWGLTVQCPVCNLRPPPELAYGLRRWRWLAAHVSTHKPVVAVKG